MASPINLRAVQLPGGGIKRMWRPNLGRKFPLVFPDMPTIVPRGKFALVTSTSIAGARLRPGADCIDQIGGKEVRNMLVEKGILHIDPPVIDPVKMTGFALTGKNRSLLISAGLRTRGGENYSSQVVNAVCGRLMEPTDENYARALTREDVLSGPNGPMYQEMVGRFLSAIEPVLPPSKYLMLAGFLVNVYYMYSSDPVQINNSTMRECISQYPATREHFNLFRISEDLSDFFFGAFLTGEEGNYELVQPEVASAIFDLIASRAPLE